MSTHSLFGSLTSDSIPSSIDDLSHEELDKIANDCTVVAYDLVWHQGDYDQALLILQKALNIQRAYLGKHHKDVGYTCNFIGTTYWLQGKDLNKCMRYFLEARRIFCKLINNDSTESDTICTTSPLISNIDDRIHFILLRFELPPEDIRRAKLAIERTIEHELRGDRLKLQGLLHEAKEEYKRARKVAGVLRQLM
jgi:tetratricopeptide (TPR) repeat protein